MNETTRETLREIFQAGVDAVDPEAAVHRHMALQGSLLSLGGQTYDLEKFDRIVLVGAGKGTAPMARAVEDILEERLTDGRIVVKYGHGVPLARTAVVEAAHPVPDEAGRTGTLEILAMLEPLTADDLVIVALSGGGSALLPAPAAPVTLADKQETTRLLLECGATINEINAVRKHLSICKGGGLARAAFPATVISLILSDVIGDPLDVIASGPTVGDESRFTGCLELIRRYNILDKLPETARDRIERGAAGKIPETPNPGDAVFERVHNVIVGGNRAALDAAAARARERGYATLVLTSRLQGEAREVAKALTAIPMEIAERGTPLAAPACVLAGGETTVNIRGDGKGGRNQEFSLAAALALDGWRNIAVLSAGTDGTDGPTDAAGAFADGETIRRAREMGLDPHGTLDRNDSYTFFDELGGLLKTGPTRTNVMDLVLMLIDRD